MILIKNFETNVIKKIRIDDFNSFVVPSPSLDIPWYRDCLAILKQNVDHGLYILCPIYTLRGEKDFQIGVTGTYDRNDRTFADTIERECREELGLAVTSKQFNNCWSFTNRKNISLCILNMDKFKFMRPNNNDHIVHEHPIKSKKVVCFPIGTWAQVHNYITTEIGRAANLHEHVYLKEVVALPISYLVKQKII